jgi:hypothetical protein
MSVTSFDELLDLIGENIVIKDESSLLCRNMGNQISIAAAPHPEDIITNPHHCYNV